MPSPADNPLLFAALAYADRGWRVIPLCDREKAPRIQKWVQAATVEASTILDWWARWPSANVGVVLGPASGVVAIDIDSEHGEHLLREFAGGEPDATLEMRTGKGRRLLYAIPDSLEFVPSTHSIPDPAGVEAIRFQGQGGQCVMPPSIHPNGKTYAWVVDESNEPSPMPSWLIAQMAPRGETMPPANPPTAAPQWADTAAAGAFAEGGDWNARADWWRDILEPAGFTRAGRGVGDVERFTRPGKSEGVSVTVGHYRAADGTPALFVFSGSIPQLQHNKCYDKFGAYTRLFHSGDFRRAAQYLGQRGYARPRNGPSRSGPIPGQPAAIGQSVEPEPWVDPTPLGDATEEIPGFPIAVFPPSLCDLIGEIAASVQSPPDYAAAHALAVAASAIGGSFDLQIKRGYRESTNLFICTVAPSGSGKSPTAGPILEPIYEEQARRRQLDRKDPVYVEDVTTEKLAGLLDDLPRGLLMAWDEMSGWLAGFNQYKAGGKGSDRAHYLSIWDGRALKVDRRNPEAPAVFVRFPRLTIVGGIQPSVLDDLRAGPIDGLFERMLFAFPIDQGLPPETWAEVPEIQHEHWKSAIAALWLYQMHEDVERGKRPNCILLTPDAREVWHSWTSELHTLSLTPEQPAYLRPVVAKLRGIAARLALILHLLDEAYGLSAPVDRGVKARDMERGILLARYFLAHAGRVFRRSGRDPRVTRAKAVLNWLAGRGQMEFTRHDAWAGLHRNSVFDSYEDLAEPLKLLAAHRCIRWRENVNAGSSGRRNSGRYEVNPRVLTGGD